MSRIGLIGGTFDPIHKGHIRLAYAALEACDLDRVIFIPAAHPPHKGHLRMSSFRHRIKMLEIAVAAERRFLVSDVESRLDRPSYTYQTLRKLKKTIGDDSFHFIIGSDAFIEIESWKNWQEVLGHINFIIAVRPGSNVQDLNILLEDHGFSYMSERKWSQVNSDYVIVVLEADFMDISSTDVRSKIEQGEGWEQLLAHCVVEYIKDNQLYC